MPPFSRFFLPLAFVAAFSGCSKSVKPAAAQDDEAQRNGKTEADYRYHIRAENGELTNNYFKGMDAIATTPGSTRDNAFAGTESAPVDQLLDKPLAMRMPKIAAPAPESAPAPAHPSGSGSDQPPRQLIDAVATPNEVLGRNTWLAWCGGNEGFWDWLGSHGYGFTDFLKLIDSRNRSTRFKTAGMINEPGMRQASAPNEYGVWLDEPTNDPAEKGRPHPIESIYGRSTGIVGLRLFDNPNFTAAAKAKWDPKRYYEDPDYFNDPGLVRPYRVGMSCAFCHASWHPLKPPSDLTNPRWENISGSIGAQYLRIRAVVGNLLKEDNFVYHLLDSQPPGTVDTSLVASDNINNPNAMNAIFGLKQRVVVSFRNPQEKQASAALTQPALWGNPTGPLENDDGFVWKQGADGKLNYAGQMADKVPAGYWNAFCTLNIQDRVAHSNTVLGGSASAFQDRYVPRVLFDGADSIGAWGALARVYLNIGTYWEQWNTLHRPLVGFQPQQAFAIADCNTHSVYWRATQERVAPLRDYFLKVTPPMPLLATPNGLARAVHGRANSSGRAVPAAVSQERARHIDIDQLARGRQVFAHNCIVCHSSQQPDFRRKQYDEWAAKTPSEPWDHDPGQWLTNPEYIKWAEQAVECPDFWRNNYLSTDYRVAVNVVGTNSARAVATNGLRGHMWNDFSSESYKLMPAIGAIPFFNPYKGPQGGDDSYTPRHKAPPMSPECGGGVGFYRVPTLISIWTSAPLLHNNSLGLFNNDPSVDGRLDAFDDAMVKLLFPERRLESSSYNGADAARLHRDHGLIWRTPVVSYLSLPPKYIPDILAKVPFVASLEEEYEHGLRVSPLLRWLTHPLWLPSALLFTAAALVLIFGGRRSDPSPVVVRRRRRWTRAIGYVLVLAALCVGAVLYVIAGELGTFRLGPIPAGTPVNLLANLNPDADPADLKAAIKTTTTVLAEIQAQHLDEADARRLMREEVAPALMKVNKCPDFVMDKGHYLPWFEGMSDEDKYALIELLKTF